MRLEAIEKEAKLYDREDECYIHIERTTNRPFTFVTAGDGAVIAQAIYVLCCQFCKENGHGFKPFLKEMMNAYKKFGPAKAVEIGPQE